MEDNNTKVEQLKSNIVDKSTFFFTVSTTKMIVMSLVTLGLYQLYWFYKNWVSIKEQTKEDMKPFWRTFFAPVWAYLCFENIKTTAIKSNIETTLPIGWLAFLYFFSCIALNFSDPYWVLGYLGVFLFIPVNSLALKINLQKDESFINNSKFSLWNWALMLIIGALVTLMIVFQDYADMTSDKSLQRASDELNSTLPMMVDDTIRLDSTFGKNKMLVYNYTMIDPEGRVLIENNTEELQKDLNDDVCNSNKAWIEGGVTFVYKYYDNNNKFIAEFATSFTDCDYDSNN